MSCAVCCGKENRFRTQNQYLVPQMEGEIVRKLASAVRARPGTIYFLSGNKGKNVKTRTVLFLRSPEFPTAFITPVKCAATLASNPEQERWMYGSYVAESYVG